MAQPGGDSGVASRLSSLHALPYPGESVSSGQRVQGQPAPIADAARGRNHLQPSNLAANTATDLHHNRDQFEGAERNAVSNLSHLSQLAVQDAAGTPERTALDHLTAPDSAGREEPRVLLLQDMLPPQGPRASQLSNHPSKQVLKQADAQKIFDKQNFLTYDLVVPQQSKGRGDN